MIITPAALDGLFRGFTANFIKGVETAAPQYREIAMLASSQTRESTYTWLGQVPRVREWLGERRVKSLAAHSYAIQNRNFEDTIEVPANDIKDDQYGAFAPLVTELGRAAGDLPDELCFGLLSAGFTTTCYDGQNFFDTDHPTADAQGQETTVSNMTAGAGTPWFLFDTSRAVKPLIYQEREKFELTGITDPKSNNVFWRDTYVYGLQGRANAGFGLWQLAHASKADLTIENYIAARNAMSALRGDEGRPLGIRADTLVVPVSLEAAGRAVLHKANLEGGESNEWAGTAKLIVSPWLG